MPFPYSRTPYSLWASFISQRLDRLQAGGLLRRQVPEEKSRGTRHHERDHHAETRNRNPQISRQKQLRAHRYGDPDQNPDNRPSSADNERFDQELIHDLPPRRPNGLANPDLPRPFRHRHQHDVHDPDSADHQCDERNDDQHDRQRQRDFPRYHQNCIQGLHLVFRLSRMPAPQQLAQLPLDGWHVFGPRRLHVQQAHHFEAGVVLHHREGDNDGIFVKVGKVESLDSLAENADHRERQVSHSNGFPDRIVLPKDAVGKLRRDQANLAAHLHIRNVEIPPAKDDQAPYGLISIRHPHHAYRTLRSIRNHGHRQFPRSRNLDHIRDGFGGFHVFQRHFITQRLWLIRPLHQLHPHQVRADTLDPRKHEFLAGQRHGDDQHDGSASNNHAQRRQHRAQLICSQRVDRHGNRLSYMDHRLLPVLAHPELSSQPLFNRFNASCAILFFESSLSALSYSLAASSALPWFSKRRPSQACTAAGRGYPLLTGAFFKYSCSKASPSSRSSFFSIKATPR